MRGFLVFTMSAAVGNKYAIGNKGGRPAKYESPEELIGSIMAFFDYCNEDKIKATITGLTLYLGFCSRSSLDDYIEKNDEYSYIIKRAKLAVENSYELSGQTIDIFALKNMGWKDKTEQDLRVDGGVILAGVRPKDNLTITDLNGGELLLPSANGNGKDH